MLQKAFFKVDVVDKIYDTLVFEKTTPGAYEFTVPEEYNYVVIECAGGAGGKVFGSGEMLTHEGGKGSIKSIRLLLTSKNINGVVGATGESGGIRTSPSKGGVGYSNGEDGAYGGEFFSFDVYCGSGGGSTSVKVNNIIYEASAGGGARDTRSGSYGGRGGGQYGGKRQTASANGNNATDPNQIGLNSGNGYVKIWAGYDPYFKG